MLKNQNFAYLDFDDEKLLGSFDEDAVMQALQEVYPDYDYIMLDEIQNLPGWDLWVSKLYRRGNNIIITGSNSNLLSSEMASMLTGRFLAIEILPFSLTETLEYKHIGLNPQLPKEKADFMLQVDDYFRYGGYPETINSRSIVENYLSSLFDSIILKDIVRRHKVRKAEDLYELAKFLLSNFARPFTANSIMTDLDFTSKTTVQKFCRYLNESYLLFFLPRYNNKMKLMLKAPQKVYAVDNGFLASSTFQISENRGRLLENLVFLELLRRNLKIGKNIFYYKNRYDKEVDFVVRDGNHLKALIQVCYQVDDQKTKAREVNSLIDCYKDFNEGEMFIITWDTEMEIGVNDKSVHVLPFYVFCLSESKWRQRNSCPIPTISSARRADLARYY